MAVGCRLVGSSITQLFRRKLRHVPVNQGVVRRRSTGGCSTRVHSTGGCSTAVAPRGPFHRVCSTWAAPRWCAPHGQIIFYILTYEYCTLTIDVFLYMTFQRHDHYGSNRIQLLVEPDSKTKVRALLSTTKLYTNDLGADRDHWRVEDLGPATGDGDGPSVLHAGRSTGVAPRGPLHGGRSTGGSQIFFILTCAQY